MNPSRLASRLPWPQLFALLLAFTSLHALAQDDPPTRVANISATEGSVVFAPAGETEWIDAVLNRPLTDGDRLWTDRGARAEVHLGSAVLHLDDESFLEVRTLDQDSFQASLHEGALNARVRELSGSENFEIDTPQLAFRAVQPGDFRIDVDPARGTTAISVRSGTAVVYGDNGQALQLAAGQQLAFAGRALNQVAASFPAQDKFDRWAEERNSREDQSIAARFVPRDVVGYSQLDLDGNWVQVASYGPVWYPAITVADWAPYRYGHWEWIRPWGWTWIDNARWGFAPFHYGRWALIGSRWAWVPGRLGPRPAYAPALVAFVGGAGNASLSIGSGPGIAWYPLAPGEAWRPWYRTSAVYLRNANRFVSGASNSGVHVHRRHPEAITAVRIDDFNRGRPVQRSWQHPSQAELARAQIVAPPARLEPRRDRVEQQRRSAAVPQASPQVGAPRAPAQISAPQIGGQRPVQPQVPRAREEARSPQPRPFAGGQRGEAEDPRAQQQLERARREQQQEQLRLQREQQLQQSRLQREQQQQQQMQRQREDHERQQQALQERSRREQELQQRRAAPLPMPPAPLPPAVIPPAVQPRAGIAPAGPVVQPPPARGEAIEERRGRGLQQREDRFSPGEDENGRNRGRGQGGRVS